MSATGNQSSEPQSSMIGHSPIIDTFPVTYFQNQNSEFLNVDVHYDPVVTHPELIARISDKLDQVGFRPCSDPLQNCNDPLLNAPLHLLELFEQMDGAVNRRVVYVVEKYKDVEAEDEEGMRKMAGELLESIFRNKIDNWDKSEDWFPYGIDYNKGGKRWITFKI